MGERRFSRCHLNAAMKKAPGAIVLFLWMLVAAMPAYSQPDKTDDFLILSGYVKDAVTKEDLVGAKIIFYSPFKHRDDTVTALTRHYYRADDIREVAVFSIAVAKKDTTYVIEVMHPGYETQLVTVPVAKVGKRENYRDIPVVFLQRATKKLGNVTVTASKVKFYNKGDTIVYNADAFQLAEGSMLDALIAQLPGAELNSDGQIKINGEFVETLLLNGRDFFKGDNKIMLENIGAYTVKNIEVYKGQTQMEKWVNDSTAEKHLTMDVKLKKEYMRGWIINAQAAGGTKERYLGKLFASMFTPTTNLTFVGNANNLNDNRNPGKNDSWTPEMMPSGTRKYHNAAMDYEYRSPDEKKSFSGYVKFEGNTNRNVTTTARTNFFSSGDTYDNSFRGGKDNDIKLETRNYANLETNRWYWWHMVLGRFIKRDSRSSSLSASFNREQHDITAKALEALYSDSSPERLDAIINRSISESDNDRREWELQFYPTYNYKVPGTNDILRIQGGVKYQDRRDKNWQDYNINYGANPVPADVKRQFTNESPFRTLTLDGTVQYNFSGIKNFGFSIEYSYRFLSRDKNSSMYALDRLADMGIFGTLPADYESAFDPMNSYTSRLIENKHDIIPRISWYNISDNGEQLIVYLRPTLSILHQNLAYERNYVAYPVRRTSFVSKIGNTDARIDYRFRPYQDGKSRSFSNMLQYTFNLDTRTPDLMHLIDIENDTDPLNISLGNPGLKNAITMRHQLTWNFRPAFKYLNNSLRLSYETIHNALVRGYTYNTTTGVRHNRTYNVNGNNTFSGNNSFSIQFGNKQQFMASSSTNLTLGRYADMIGVNQDEPTKSRVSSNVISQGLNLTWQIGKQSLRLNGQVSHRHTSSTREDFNTIDANHYRYGILGNFFLPAGFGINTDFTLYTRTGYGSKELDTTDAIWNLQLSYTPPAGKGRWVFMLDSFDILKRLTNVHYAVTASGRTVSYTNALPRYVMLSIQYRINIQPRKRK